MRALKFASYYDCNWERSLNQNLVYFYWGKEEVDARILRSRPRSRKGRLIRGRKEKGFSISSSNATSICWSTSVFTLKRKSNLEEQRSLKGNFDAELAHQ